jgi:antitoxin component of RelBE/YafQ-DinJ toxin-antitoxin module
MSTRKYTKTAAIAARVAPSVKAVAEEMCAQDELSLSAFIETLLRKEARYRGLLIRPRSKQRTQGEQEVVAQV